MPYNSRCSVNDKRRIKKGRNLSEDRKIHRILLQSEANIRKLHRKLAVNAITIYLKETKIQSAIFARLD